MFHVVIINERTGLEVRVSSSPLTHHEGCVFLSKLMSRPHLRNCLQDDDAWGVDEWERTDHSKRQGTYA